LRTKNKSFIEDTFIIFIFGIIIYVIYSFFFSSDEKIITEENKTIIETKIETKIDKDPVIDEIKKDEVLLEEVDKSINESQKDDIPITESVINTESETLIEEKIDSKETEKPVLKLDNEKSSVELLYKDISEKISTNIAKDFEKNLFKDGEFINIRLTILKSGKYEQLTFMNGNNEYFNIIKPSITKVFPVKIDDKINDSFPRYFRMKIEF
jgi:hypothetical protein